MSKRRLERPASVAGKRRAARPRYGRISAAGSALAITLVTLLGGIGVLPQDGPAVASSTSDGGAGRASNVSAALPETPAPSTPAVTPSPSVGAPAAKAARVTGDAAGVPASSGTGKRVVFDISDQRVWLVGTDGELVRSYLVSGSVTDNLQPGTYAVYSRSRHAVGIDDSGTMEYFARFTRGANAPIGFHSIPTKDGKAVQTLDQLGTPLSHGCIRQALPDARTLWDFAPEGTKVVVTA